MSINLDEFEAEVRAMPSIAVDFIPDEVILTEAYLRGLVKL